MTELVIQTGKHQGKKINLAGLDCFIGRHESCKIRIASGDVSKQHCRLKHKKGGVHAKDMGSRNGTFVNDKILDKEVLLQPGDLLRIGPMIFLVSEAKTASEPPAEASESPASPKTAKGQPQEAKPADDDLIAAWLSEGENENSGNDSTIIFPSPVQQKPEETADEDQTSLSTQSTGSGNSQKSVKERAAEIIRRFHKEQGKG